MPVLKGAMVFEWLLSAKAPFNYTGSVLVPKIAPHWPPYLTVFTENSKKKKIIESHTLTYIEKKRKQKKKNTKIQRTLN